jgi:hypothetical protein
MYEKAGGMLLGELKCCGVSKETAVTSLSNGRQARDPLQTRSMNFGFTTKRTTHYTYTPNTPHLHTYDSVKMSTKPTLIIAHDAFHKASQYERFRRALADVGIENTIIPQLPTSCVSIPTDAFAKDVETIDDIILDEITNDRDVVILVHGYAGIAVTNALTNVQDIVGVYAPDSIKGRILGLVFVAGVVPKKGEDLTSALWTGIGDWVTCEVCLSRHPAKGIGNLR